MTTVEPTQVPAIGRAARWYEDAVIYELHVRAYHDSNGDGVGDLRGLVSKLDHVRDLGADTIWLLPFYPSPLRDDGYDTAEYKGVHPMYGSLADFRAFMREAKRRGLRVITELVLNHTSDEHPWFQRARRARHGSWQRNFYVWSDTPDRYRDARIIFQDFESSNWAWDPIADRYYWHRFYAHQPDLNFDEPRVRRAMFDVVDFWMGLGVDGLRLDAVPYLFEREGTNCENLPETFAFLSELRAHVDANFDDRVLLAEANQWPEDAVAYFGDGDRCHMAFHFPLMPRMFMATRMEDRFPVVDILQQTPSIPDGAQWATFLRNHDELTLEMVTDEERDYMYRVYADDPQARVNLGIRRRLAPLLNNDRRRIEMMNALLFSLPGTPVIYYGDEIGMGDNIYLGDRNGVRTPMQWNTDRNAGFSAANPQRLYLPVIADPEYQPGAVNVEAQDTNANSLLWWMRHLIDVRRQSSAFALGTLEFLFPDNRKVLVFLREHDDERVLVVVNLSRAAQFVELDLSRFAGMVPVEMFGPTEFPRIGELPYFVTLGPFGAFWFRLEAPRDENATAEPPTITLRRGWRDVIAGDAFARLAAGMTPYLRSQRWFGAKGERIDDVRAIATVPVDAGAVGFIEVRPREGDAETYAVPMATRAAGEEPVPPPYAVIADVTAADDHRLVVDGLWDPAFATALLEIVERRRTVRGSAGRLVGSRTEAFAELRGDPSEALEPRVAGAEQSNTSLIFGDRLIMKVFRRPGTGRNPDLEISEFLTTRARFPHTPQVAGAIEFVPPSGQRQTVAMLQAFVPNEGDAWAFTLDAIQASFEEGLVGSARDDTTSEPAPTTQTPSTGGASEVLGTYAEVARLLGQRTAELHVALASVRDDDAFAPEPFTRLYQRSLLQSLTSQVRRTFRRLRRGDGDVPEVAALLDREGEVLGRIDDLLSDPIGGVRIRHHGDYHLGQVLWTGRDVVIIDFEGEPARPLSERRIKRSALRDVAGMLRSFDYAAETALRSPAAASIAEHLPERVEPWARRWANEASAAFLASYLETVRAGAHPVLPPTDDETERLLAALVLEKAVYELRYELDHRPDWLATPARGLTQLLDGAAT
ncbi:MAG TPA: maltose alpha-D-glucosyltransferase [Actinomycetota bacterium]|nr:maltose alpha-D-glucosyltransferase [Actinomycetota bacterium]